MSTRSTIALKNSDGSITAIYCHSNGHVHANGAILNHYFCTEELAVALMLKGDMSYIGEGMENSMSYKEMRDEICPAKEFADFESWVDAYGGCDYAYMFDPDTGKWRGYEMYGYAELIMPTEYVRPTDTFMGLKITEVKA